MKKYILILVLFVLFLAALTTPTKQEYVEWLKQEIKQESNSNLVSFGVNLIGSLLIENSSSCKNLIFITLCNTSITSSDSFNALGLFNNFFSVNFTSNLVSLEDNDSKLINSKIKQTTSTPINNKTEVSSVSDKVPLTPAPSSDWKDSKLVEEIVDLPLERIYIRNFKTNKELKDFIEWTFDDINNDKILPINLKDKKAELVLGIGHPNLFDFIVSFEEERIGLRLPVEDKEGWVLNDYGDLNDESLTVQVTTHDFGDSETGEKLIIAISDNASIGMFWVISYTPVDDLTKINPFYLELSGFMQDKIWIDVNKLYVPIGGNGIIDRQYEWINNKFYNASIIQ